MSPSSFARGLVDGDTLRASAGYTTCNTDDDFLIDNRKVEVGGKKKDRKNADYVVRDDVDLPSVCVIPLWMLGLEY